MCAYHGVRNVRISENLAYFVFLQQPFWDIHPFALIPDELVEDQSRFIVREYSESKKVLNGSIPFLRKISLSKPSHKEWNVAML